MAEEYWNELREFVTEKYWNELREFGEAYLRWAAYEEAMAPGSTPEERVFPHDLRIMARRYPPIAEAALGGTEQDEKDAIADALSDYKVLVVERAGSRAAGAATIVVTAIVTLGLWTRGLPTETLVDALFSSIWWGAPAVVIAGFLGSMHQECRWEAVHRVPRSVREWLHKWLFLELGLGVLTNRFSLAAVFLGVCVLLNSQSLAVLVVLGALLGSVLALLRMRRAVRRGRRLGIFLERFFLAAFSFGICMFVGPVPPDLVPEPTTERMMGCLIGTVGFWCIPWGRLWQAITRRPAPRA